MTAVAFALTEVSSSHNWIQGTTDKKKRFTVQMPSAAWLAAGVACDLSTTGGFTAVAEASFGVGTLVTDHQCLWGLFGAASGNSDGAIAASTAYITGYGTKHGTSANDVLTALPDATDLSVVAALCMTVYGY